jgi:alpha-D-ribose 1-methylphosphonate 5-triphosphate synthase subunit PhnH
MWEGAMLEVAPIWQPDIQQQNYRVLLEAMARPGSVQTLLGLDENPTAEVAVLATLLDASVTLCDCDGLLSDSDLSLLQTGLADPEQADYLLCSGRRVPGFEPKLGTLPSPEQSATLLIRVTALDKGELRLDLAGPGIKGGQECSVAGLDPQWLARREDWVCGFPLGVDLILVDEKQVLALPRTTRVEVR